jgi:hypothetical protein
MRSFATNRSAAKCGVLLQIAVQQVVTDCDKLRSFVVSCNGVSRVDTSVACTMWRYRTRSSWRTRSSKKSSLESSNFTSARFGSFRFYRIFEISMLQTPRQGLRIPQPGYGQSGSCPALSCECIKRLSRCYEANDNTVRFFGRFISLPGSGGHQDSRSTGLGARL